MDKSDAPRCSSGVRLTNDPDAGFDVKEYIEELRRLAGQEPEAVDELAHTGPDQAEDAEAGEEGAEEASEEETHGEERELS